MAVATMNVVRKMTLATAESVVGSREDLDIVEQSTSLALSWQTCRRWQEVKVGWDTRGKARIWHVGLPSTAGKEPNKLDEKSNGPDWGGEQQS